MTADPSIYAFKGDFNFKIAQPKCFVIAFHSPDGPPAQVIFDPETRTVRYEGDMKVEEAARLLFEGTLANWKPCTCQG